MNANQAPYPIIQDELDLLHSLVPVDGREIIELGCGAARLARALLQRYPGSKVTGLEVDERQHAKNLTLPQSGLQFLLGGAQAIPFQDASFDAVLMLKSLHHVPLALLGKALSEAGRVLRPGGHLYVSEPVYAGTLNELIRVYNDEKLVRAAAQAALDDAVASGFWQQTEERFFGVPASFTNFSEFEQRMMRPTFADHHIDANKLEAVKALFTPHLTDNGAHFAQPMHVRVLQKR